MRRKVTKRIKNDKKKQNNEEALKPKLPMLEYNKTSTNSSELRNFTHDNLQLHVSDLHKAVRKAVGQKNAIIKELQGFNEIVKGELSTCKSNLKEKNDKIKHLENEKEEFKNITLAEVEKFDQTYQCTIQDLKAENGLMKDELSKQENMLIDYEKQIEELKLNRGNNDDFEYKKSEKLVKKYKDLKGKIRTLDSVLSENEKQKEDLRKHIEAKDELIKLKDIEIHDLDKRLSEERSKTLIISSLRAERSTLEYDLKAKDVEAVQLNIKLKEDSDLYTIKLKMLDTTVKQKQQTMNQMTATHNDGIEQWKRKMNDLENECKKLRELQKIIKMERDSMDEMKEGFHLQFKEAFAEKDGHIKELEDRNAFICKENEEVRVDMRKLVEARFTEESIIKLMKKSVADKNTEISNLKLTVGDLRYDVETNAKIMKSMIEKKNSSLSLKDQILDKKDFELKARDSVIAKLKEQNRKPESEKRLTDIIGALEANNARLEREMAILRKPHQSDQMNKNENNDSEISKLNNKIMNLIAAVSGVNSSNSKLQQELLVQKILLEETERDRDYFENMWKEINNEIGNFVQTDSSVPSGEVESEEATGESAPRLEYNWPVVPWTPQSGTIHEQTDEQLIQTTDDDKKRKMSQEELEGECVFKKVKHILDLCNITVENQDSENDVVIIDID